MKSPFSEKVWKKGFFVLFGAKMAVFIQIKLPYQNCFLCLFRDSPEKANQICIIDFVGL